MFRCWTDVKPALRRLNPGLAALLVLLTCCASLKRLTPADRLSDDDKLNYLILASLDPAAAETYSGAPSRAERRAYFDWFWTESASADINAPEALQQMYRERAERAREFFGQVDLLNDERVRTYIRHGPARRESFDPEQIRSETLTVIVNPAEIWTYDSLGLQFDFVKSGTAFRLVGETASGPGVAAPALEPVDLGLPAPSPAPGAEPLGAVIATYRLRQHADTVEVELHYGIPLDRLAQTKRNARLPLANLRLELTPRGDNNTIGRSLWVTPTVAPDTTDRRLAVGRMVLELPADNYDLVMVAVNDDGTFATTQKRNLNLLDYVRRAQPASDVVFCSLVDMTSQSPQFERGDWKRLVPMVLPLEHSGRTFSILYELYNLGTDEEGRHDVQASYDIIHSDTHQSAVVPTPEKRDTDPGTTATLVERVHTMDLRPGNYLLVARARDVIRERDLSLTARFTILER